MSTRNPAGRGKTLMTAPIAPVTIVVSIDADSAASRRPCAARRSVEASVERAVDSLLRFFADHGVPATWNFVDPAASPLTRHVRTSGGDHEIALGADAGWAGPDVGRRRFADELSQRMAAAHSAGYSISTLSLGAGAVTQQLDLLVQHGITAVCAATTASLENTRAAGLFKLHAWRGAAGRAETASQPRPLRWGLWHVPAGCDLLRNGPRRMRHQIELAAQRGGPLQCLVDVAALTDQNLRMLRTLDAAFTHIFDRRDAGSLRISTVTRVVDTLGRRSTPPARSILHRQAA
jgi:hypothetical protein